MASKPIVSRDPEFANLLFSTYQEAGVTQFLLIQPNSKRPLRDEDTGSWQTADVSTAFQHWQSGAISQLCLPGLALWSSTLTRCPAAGLRFPIS